MVDSGPDASPCVSVSISRTTELQLAAQAWVGHVGVSGPALNLISEPPTEYAGSPWRFTEGCLDHLRLTPAIATMSLGASQAYTVEGYDASDADLGPVTRSVQLSISPDGSCTPQACTATKSGPHTVTASVGDIKADASLNVGPNQLHWVGTVSYSNNSDHLLTDYSYSDSRTATWNVDAYTPDGYPDEASPDDLTYTGSTWQYGVQQSHAQWCPDPPWNESWSASGSGARTNDDDPGQRLLLFFADAPSKSGRAWALTPGAPPGTGTYATNYEGCRGRYSGSYKASLSSLSKAWGRV